MKLAMYAFLSAHFLGDYYFQSKWLAGAKVKSIRALVIHTSIHLLLMLIVSMLFQSRDLIYAACLIALVHGLLDYLKGRWSVNNKLDKLGEKVNNPFVLYILDQILHLLVILLVIYQCEMSQPIQVRLFLQEIFLNFQLDIDIFAKISLILIILIQPTNITMRLFLDQLNFRWEDSDNQKQSTIGLANAGAIIGILERLIMFLLIIKQQYGAIGFVLTAKSITRYEKIISSPQFAEYYLIGTLLSTVIVLTVTMLIY